LEPPLRAVVAHSRRRACPRLCPGLRQEELADIVRTALSFGPGEREQRVAALAKEALVKIGQESKLNQRRVGKFGIRV
jgi:hypothetical protein